MKSFYTYCLSLALCLLWNTTSTNAQSITLVNPNGGETLASCQNYTVTWNTNGVVSTYYDVQYSLNGGAIWTSVASNYLATNRQFVWTVPNVTSNTVLMRVRDNNDTTKNDISNAVFSIRPPVTITSPNGGNVFTANTTQTIAWSQVNTSGRFLIEYSKNGGSSWTTITNNYTGTSFNWLIPAQATSTQMYIRVTDMVTGCMTDMNDTPFTVNACAPIITYPNGGEVLQVNTSAIITWTTQTLYENARLEYTTDNGATWNLIVGSTPNSGTYNWTVPAVVSSTCKIRLSNTSDPANFDLSNSNFSIARPLVITAPTTGAVFEGCSTITVRFNRSAGLGYVEFYLAPNGTTYTTYLGAYSANTGTTGTFTYQLPEGMNSLGPNARIRGIGPNFPTLAVDTSLAFTINPSDRVTITAPQTGSTLTVGTNVPITYAFSAPATQPMVVQYYGTTTGGSSQSGNIVSNSTVTNVWTVPNFPGNYNFRVYSSATPCYAAEIPFTIVPAQPVLIYPNGGEILQVNTTVAIAWNANTISGNAKLEYTTDNGATWNLIVASTANAGSYNWTVPAVVSTQYKVRLTSVDYPSLFDESNTIFTVPRPLVITYPTTGAVIEGCSTINVRFNRSAGLGYVEFYLAPNGTNYTTYLGAYSTTTGTTGTFTYQFPEGMNSLGPNARIRGIGPNFPLLAVDTSLAFTINPSDRVSVTAPQTGSTLTVGTNVPITYAFSSPATQPMVVQYYGTTTGGSSQSGNIVSNSTVTNVWNVPNIPGNYNFRVYSSATPCYAAEIPFTIVPAQPVLIYPNGGEILQVNTTVAIAWNANTISGNAKLEYTTDNGATWNLIVASTANAGSYNWTVPAVVSTRYKVRLTSVDYPTLFDESNTTFTVPRPLVITYPTSGAVIEGCSTINVRFNRSAGLGYVEFYLAPDGTNYNTYLGVYSTTTGTTGTFTYQFPEGMNSLGPNARIRGIGPNFPLLAVDTSLAFTINPSDRVTITAPQTGSTLTVGTNVPITYAFSAPATQPMVVQYYGTTTGGSSQSGNIVTNSTVTNVWTVPNFPGNYNFRVYSSATPCYTAEIPFSILPANPVLTYPNGGEILQVNTTIAITWNANTISGNAKLEYTTDNGVTWNLIVASTANAGSYNWTVPAVVSTQYKVRLTSVDYPSLFDESNTTFTVPRPLVITYPTTGAVIEGCSTINVRFNRSAGLGYVEFYLAPNGTNYTTYLGAYSTTTGTTGTFTYQFPEGMNSLGPNARIRGIGPNFPLLAVDTSLAFTINPSDRVSITAPQTGSTLTVGTNVPITYAFSAPATQPMVVQYYGTTTGGSSQSGNIVTNSTVTNVWTVPNFPGNYNFRVYSSATPCYAAEIPFTIVPAQPVLTYPNGGEILQVNTTVAIAWNTSSISGNAKLEYTTDNGATWNLIVASTANAGSYNWTVPAVISTQYKVRLTSVDYPTLFDESNTTFTVPRPLVITYPTTGAVIEGCSTINVRFNRSAGLGYVEFYLAPNGTNYTTYLGAYSTTTGTTGTFTYQFPEGMNSLGPNARIRGIGPNFPLLAVDTSLAFTINPSDRVTITAPQTGSTLVGNSAITLTYAFTSPATQPMVLQYYGTNWAGNSQSSNIVTNSSTVNSWNVPNIPGTYNIRAYSSSTPCYEDENAITITPATPFLTSPNGGETLWAGVTYPISWLSSSLYNNARLEYSTDNGATWNLIVASAPNSGSYNWTVPTIQDQSDRCLVRISNTDLPSLTDVSNAVFTIKPPVRVIAPNGTATNNRIGGCTITSFTFERSTAWNNYTLQYSLDDGTNWITVNSGYSSNPTTATQTTFNWNAPVNPTTQARVRVIVNGTGFTDVSDQPFEILKPVTIVQPNYGGVLQVGTTYTIRWRSDGISNIFNLYYSVNGGSTWNTIVTNYNSATSSYVWTVPNALSNNALVRIVDGINTCKTDDSDVFLTISNDPPPITLVSPNGIDTLSGCLTVPITWTELAAPAGLYNISYSSNYGQSYQSIVSNYATTNGSYDWVLPNNLNSEGVLVRVTSALNATVTDQSDALFAITPTTVSAGRDTTICAGSSAVLLGVGGVGTQVWTPSSTLNNANLLRPTASPLTTTTYILTSQNAACTLVDSVLITVLPGTPPTVTVTPSANNICAGTAVTFTATGNNFGPTPRYQWQRNGTNVGTNSPTYVNATLTNNDVVRCLVTPTNGCGGTATSAGITMTVITNINPTVTVSSQNVGNCASPLVTFTATSNAANVIYQWSVDGVNRAGANASTFNITPTATFVIVRCAITVTAGCTNGTTAISTGVVSVLPSALVATSSAGSVTVFNGNTNVTVSASAGTAPYTGTGVFQRGPGVHVFTVTDAFGCSATTSVTITNCTLPASVTQSAPADAATNVLIPASLSWSAVSGATSYLVQVSTDVNFSSFIANTTTTSLSSSQSGLATGTQYFWRIAANNTCGTGAFSNTRSFTTTTQSAPICTTLVATGLPITITDNSTVGVTSTISFPSAGTITDVNIRNVSITHPYIGDIIASIISPSGTAITFSNRPCNGTTTANMNLSFDDASATTATPCPPTTGATIRPSSAFSTFNGGNPAGTWGLKVTDLAAQDVGTLNGWSLEVCYQALPAGTCLFTITPTASSIGCNNAPVTLTASGGTNYTWLGTTVTGASFVATSAGVYTVTGTGANACTGTANITITNNTTAPNISVTSSGTLSCTLSAVQITASGGTSYLWENGSSATARAVSVAGLYSVTGTGTNGCTGTASVSVTSTGGTALSGTPVLVSPATGTTPTSIRPNMIWNTMSGATSYFIQGSTASNFSTTAFSSTVATGTTFTPPNNLLANTTYYWRVRGINSCGNGTLSPSFNFTTGTLCQGFAVTATPTSNSGCTSANGSVVVNVSAASQPITYTWSNGTTNATGSITGLTAGTYRVTVTDNITCSATASATVTSSVVNPTLTIATPASLTCVNASVVLSAFSNASTYLWSTGATAATATASATGTYTVTGTDAFGCTVTASRTVGSNTAPPNAFISAPVTLTCSVLATTVTASGGGTYSWDNQSTTASRVLTAAGIYRVTVTGTNGCTATAARTVTSNTTPPPVSIATPATITCAAPQVTLTATGASTYTWSGGGTAATKVVTTAGVYTVTGTGSNGCTATANTTITSDGSSVPVGVATLLAPADGSTSQLLRPTFSWSAVSGSASYLFQISTNIGFTNITTATVTGTTYTPTNDLAANTTIYWRIIPVNSCGNGTTSSAFSLNIGPGCTGFAVSATATANTNCVGNNGSVSVSVSAGTAPFTYSWSNGGTSASLNAIAAGAYTVTVSDANACTVTTSATVTNSFASPTITISGSSTLTCANTAITLTANSNATNFNWSNGIATATNVVTSAGTYTVTGTAANGCSAVASVTITSNTTPPTAAISAPVTLTCSVLATTVTASGGGTYSWDNQSTTASRVLTAAGVYRVTVTGTNGCTATAARTVSSNTTPPPVSIATPATITCAAPQVTLTATGASTYTWSGGGTAATKVVTTAGVYTVTGTGSNGCTATASVTVQANRTAPALGISTPATLTCAVTQTVLTANGANTYTWTGGLTGASITATSAGTYTFTGTGTNGCTATLSSTVSSNTTPPSISVTASAGAISCATPNVTLTATGGTSFVWDNGATGANRVVTNGGLFTVTGMGANGCTATASIQIQQSGGLSASAVAGNILVNGGSTNVTVTATGGTPPYTGTGVFVRAAGQHSFTVTDAGGCLSIASVSITEPATLQANAIAGNIACNGGSASITITANGGVAPYSGTGIFVRTVGTHTFTVTDVNGATATTSVTVTQPNAITVSAVAGNILVFGGSTSVTVSATGGTAPYTGTGTFNATAGTRAYTVTDANGCSSSVAITITQPTQLRANATAGTIACNGGSGNITVTATGGVQPYTGTGTFDNTAGTYTFTVTDANGAVATASATLIQPTALNISATVSGIITCANPSVTLNANSANSYVWSNGAQGSPINVSAAGIYTVTGTSAQGCTATASVVVNEDTTSPSIGIATPAVLTCANTQVTLTANGGVSYIWNNGATTGNNVVTAAGTYSVTGTGQNGCTSSASVAVTSNTTPPPSFVVTQSQISTNATYPSTLTVGGYQPNLYTYTLRDFVSNSILANITSPTVQWPTGGTFKVECRSNTTGCVVYSNRIKLTYDANYGYPVSTTNVVVNRPAATPKSEITDWTTPSTFEGDVLVFPNPASDVLNLVYDFGQEQELQLSLYSAEGKLVWQKQTSTAADKLEVNVSELPAGPYFLRTVHGAEVKSQLVQIVR